MEAPQSLYNQTATHFTLRFFVKSETTVDGQLVVELANTFLSDLVFPGCRVISLDTKRPGLNQKLNMGEFSERRWAASVKKILAGEYAVVIVKAQTPDFPNQQIWLSIHVNPPRGDEIVTSGEIEVLCSVSYLRHLATSAEKVEALLRFGKTAWNGISGGPAYGFGNLAIIPPRPAFQPWAPRPPGAPLPWELTRPPAERAHAIPVAYVGQDIDGNLESLYCSGRGIKGAFWADYLSRVHVGMAGGEQQIRAKLQGTRIESLDWDGLLIVATDSPLPEDSEENRQRFLRLHAALQPAFLSRSETPERKRELLGYFYRERASVLP
jgi:hypothetical protein